MECLKYPNVIRHCNSTSMRWNSVLKTDENFLGMIWIFVFSIKFSIWDCPFLRRNTNRNYFAALKIIADFHIISQNNPLNFNTVLISIILCMRRKINWASFNTISKCLNIQVLPIYERFLSNNFDTEIIRLMQHFWQIYLLRQTKI